MLQDNVAGNRVIDETDLINLKNFFPEINLKQLTEIQKFHKDIGIVLREEIQEEIRNIQNVIQILQASKGQVELKVKEITKTSNLSQVILFKFAQIQKEIEAIESQNKYYDEMQVLEQEKKDADSRKTEMRMQQLAQLQNMINIKMAQLNNEIYQDTKIPPTLTFEKINMFLKRLMIQEHVIGEWCYLT